MIAIQIILDDLHAIAELWVPGGTPEAAVEGMVHTYAQRYRVVVYRSGSAALPALTADLLAIQDI